MNNQELLNIMAVMDGGNINKLDKKDLSKVKQAIELLKTVESESLEKMPIGLLKEALKSEAIKRVSKKIVKTRSRNII